MTSKFQRQIWDFRPRRARRSCRLTQVTNTTTDTGNGNVAAKQEVVCRTNYDRIRIQTANLGFSIMTSWRKMCPGDCDNDQQPEVAIWLRIMTEDQNSNVKSGVFDHGEFVENTSSTCDNDRHPEMELLFDR